MSSALYRTYAIPWYIKTKKTAQMSGLKIHGGAEETRTLDPHTASVML